MNTALALTQTGTNDGSIAWDFSVANSLTQYLADGETVTATYTITVTDDSGTGTDTATQDVTVVITGTNDVATISVVDVAGAVTEDAATPNLTDSGSVTFAEVDDTDLISSSVALSSMSTTGPAIPAGLSTALNTGAGSDTDGNQRRLDRVGLQRCQQPDAISCRRRNGHGDLHDYRHRRQWNRNRHSNAGCDRRDHRHQ